MPYKGKSRNKPIPITKARKTVRKREKDEGYSSSWPEASAEYIRAFIPMESA